MTEFTKTKVHNVITVSSIMTALRADLRNWTADNERHDFSEIFYMSQGRGKTVINGKQLCLEAGQMVIYAPDALHGDGTGGIAKIISFETEAPLPESLYNRVITLSGEQRVALDQIIGKAMTLLEDRIGIRGMVLKRDADPYSLQSVKNMLEMFLLDMMRPSENYRMTPMNGITDYMMKNIGRVLTLQDISSGVGISISSLKRLVNQTYGKSPIAYFNELKMEEAKRLITDTPLNMTEVAEKLGFSSVHHFSRAFKQKTGFTPTEYEKSKRLRL